MSVRIERVYGSVIVPGEYRVLVDRLWPHGLSKEKVHADIWLKDVGPSTALREWFGHIAAKFPEFTKRYIEELHSNPAVKELEDIIRDHKDVVLLYGAKDEKHNQAVVLLHYLET